MIVSDEHQGHSEVVSSKHSSTSVFYCASIACLLEQAQGLCAREMCPTTVQNPTWPSRHGTSWCLCRISGQHWSIQVPVTNSGKGTKSSRRPQSPTVRPHRLRKSSSGETQVAAPSPAEHSNTCKVRLRFCITQQRHPFSPKTDQWRAPRVRLRSWRRGSKIATQAANGSMLM